MTHAQQAALRRLIDGPLMSRFRPSAFAPSINGRTAASLRRLGWAQWKEDGVIELGGGWSVCGPVVEITDAGRAALSEAE